MERESDREGGREEIVSTTWVGGGGGEGEECGNLRHWGDAEGLEVPVDLLPLIPFQPGHSGLGGGRRYTALHSVLCCTL